MKRYYLDAVQRVTGDYEIHSEACPRRAAPVECIYLGKFYDGDAAMAYALKHWPRKNISRLCACTVGSVNEPEPIYRYQPVLFPA